MKRNKVLMVIAGLLAALVIILLITESPEQRAVIGKIRSSSFVTSTLKADIYQEILQESVRIFSTQQ
jgi:hypothetical protein